MSEVRQSKVTSTVTSLLNAGAFLAERIRELEKVALGPEAVPALREVRRARSRMAPVNQPLLAARNAVIAARSSSIDVHQATLRTGLAALDAAKVAAVASAEVMPLVSGAAEVAALVRSINNASSVADVEAAEATFITECAAVHSEQVMLAAANAVSVATAAAGFTVKMVDLGDNVRVIGTNTEGHCLLSDVTLGADGGTSVISETLGITDGTCTDVLSKLNANVAKVGVTLGEVSRRKTGPLCNPMKAKAVAPTTQKVKVGHGRH